jgi:hypothetical protein
MKTKISLSLLLVWLLFSFKPVAPVRELITNATTLNKAMIQWKATEIQLGEIEQNKPVTIQFEFKNTGETPVIPVAALLPIL